MKKEYYQELAQAIASVGSEKEAGMMLENLLTPSEHEEVARRMQIFKLLLQGMPQRKISEKLGVSLATISRGSRELKYGKGDFASILKSFPWWRESLS